MKLRIILAIFAMTFLLQVQAHASYLSICNKTGKDLWIARAYECCYFSGEPVQWYTLGWEYITNEDCYRQNIGYRTYYFAFLYTQKGNPIFNPKNALGSMPFKKMCVDPKKDFRFDRGASAENVGNNCPEGAKAIDVSFGVQGGDNDVYLTLESSGRSTK